MTEFLNSMSLSASLAISEQDASNKLIGYLMFTQAGFVLNATWCQMSKGYRVPSTFIHYSPNKAIPSNLTTLFDDMADPDKVPALEDPATGEVVMDSSTLSSPNDWLIALQASDPTTIQATAKAALSRYHKSNISNQSRAGINGPVWECTLGSYLRGKPLGATSTTSEKDASSKLVGFLMLNQAGYTLKAFWDPASQSYRVPPNFSSYMCDDAIPSDLCALLGPEPPLDDVEMQDSQSPLKAKAPNPQSLPKGMVPQYLLSPKRLL
jgi:hypothetical protein